MDLPLEQWPDVTPNAFYAPESVLVDDVPHTYYDRIASDRIHGTLMGLNTLPSANSTSLWRNLKTKVQIPCAIDGLIGMYEGHGQQQVLIVDHDRAYIVGMPSGEETGESYTIPRLPSGDASFKVVGCSLLDHHILIMGYRYKSNAPSLIVIQRPRGAGHWGVTLFCSDIPMSGAVLSRSKLNTFLLGMLDGTMLRVNIPTTWNGDIRPGAHTPVHTITIYPPKKNLGQDVFERIQAEPRAGTTVLQLLKTSKDRVFHVGDAVPVTRIVERGRRIIASSAKGLHLFRLFALEKKERRVTLSLEHNASYDFRGNLLVIHKENNAVQLVQLHECTLEAALNPPAGLNPSPPDTMIELSSIVMHDESITIFHTDGTRRVMEMKNYAELKKRPLEDKPAVTPEQKSASFLADTVVGGGAKKKGGKKKTGGKKKK
jgi:hypothetical protein